MARFYFDIEDGEDCIDLEGTELRDDNVARQEGLRFVASLLAEAPVSDALGRKWSLLVRRDAKVVMRLQVQV